MSVLESARWWKSETVFIESYQEACSAPHNPISACDSVPGQRSCVLPPLTILCVGFKQEGVIRERQPAPCHRQHSGCSYFSLVLSVSHKGPECQFDHEGHSTKEHLYLNRVIKEITINEFMGFLVLSLR